jgi:enamine deaminase RidA (YjgF/YER057c/UK114 family)
VTRRERLRAVGLPVAASGPATPWHRPVAVDDKGFAYVSGQVPMADGILVAAGALTTEEDVERGRRCARQCAVNVLAQLEAAAGTLDGVEQMVKLTVYVASAPGFTAQPLVADAASELIHEVLGDDGRHARTAIGVAALPLDSPVEIDAVARLREDPLR